VLTPSIVTSAGEDELELVINLEFDFDRNVIAITGAKFMRAADAALYSPSAILDAAEVGGQPSLLARLSNC
jgi:hypothetical protein